jgi:hypothetical protein
MNCLTECSICGLMSDDGLDHELCYMDGTVEANFDDIE